MKLKKDKFVSITLKIPEDISWDLYYRCKEICKQKHISFSTLAERAINHGLKNYKNT